MAELTTLARPYAEAAFQLAREENQLAKWSEALRFLANLIRDPQLAAVLDDPRLTAESRDALLLSVAGERVEGLGRNFLRVLSDVDRVSLLPQIADLFDALRNTAEGVDRAAIVSALPLDAAQVDALTKGLEKRFGKRIEASVTVDPTLIGGAVISVGDTVIDGSIKSKLDAMAIHLKA